MRFPFTLCRETSSHDLRWLPLKPPLLGIPRFSEAFARDQASYDALVLVQARLKTAIIASILPAYLVALRDPVHGELLLDIPTILAHVASIHGNVTAEDLLALEGSAAGETVLTGRLSQV
jgi:hypothetical protein